MSNKDVLVSVHMITFNHEQYIGQAIDGVLFQKTTFKFELVIGEDCSTDKTANIVKEYSNKYPHIIKARCNTKNMGSLNNSLNVFGICTGKYLALCEGDDYWTDPNKLQKQVDFLEANDDYAICFHKTDCINNETKEQLFEQPSIVENTIYEFTDFIKFNPIATASVLFERKYIEQLPIWFDKAIFGDLTLYLIILLNSKKKAVCLNDTMSVYRIHSKGVHGNAHLSKKGLIKAYKEHIVFWIFIKKHLMNNAYGSDIKKTIKGDYTLLINTLLYEGLFREAFKTNTQLLFRLLYVKTSIVFYITIIKNRFK